MRVLIVDDNPADRALARREVGRDHPHAEIVEVGGPDGLEAALGAPVDVAILDYSRGWTSGMELLRRLKQAQPEASAVLFTGSLGEDLAVQAVKAGFDDYVIKDVARLPQLRAAVESLAERSRERRAARRLRERYEHLFATVPVGLFACSADGAFEDANPAMLAMLGTPDREGLRRLNLFDLVDPEGPRDWRRFTGGGSAGMEARLAPPDGGCRTVLLHVTLTGAEDWAVEGVATDVTALRTAVEQKETLLQEVFHRVYNNLQQVQSLLRLQAQRSDDPEVRQAFDDVGRRIGALAIVQQKLHQSDDFRRVEFASYLRDLVKATEALSGRADVAIELDAEPLSLDIERAMPLGLVANELLTNAVKHAFPERRPGTIRLQLRRVDGAMELTVEDDGVGAPAGSLTSASGLGGRLLPRLVQQLGGELTVDGDAGFRARVTAPL